LDNPAVPSTWKGQVPVAPRKPPHEWDEPLWRRTIASSEFDTELQSEIVRTLSSL
jgi:hypothetical protein